MAAGKHLQRARTALKSAKKKAVSRTKMRLERSLLKHRLKVWGISDLPRTLKLENNRLREICSELPPELSKIIPELDIIEIKRIDNYTLTTVINSLAEIRVASQALKTSLQRPQSRISRSLAWYAKEKARLDELLIEGKGTATSAMLLPKRGRIKLAEFKGDIEELKKQTAQARNDIKAQLAPLISGVTNLNSFVGEISKPKKKK